MPKLYRDKLLDGDPKQWRKAQGTIRRVVTYRVAERIGEVDPDLVNELVKEAVGEAYLLLLEVMSADERPDGSWGTNATMKAATSRLVYKTLYQGQTLGRPVVLLDLEKGKEVVDTTADSYAEYLATERLERLYQRIQDYRGRASIDTIKLALGELLGIADGPKGRPRSYRRAIGIVQRLALAMLEEEEVNLLLVGRKDKPAYGGADYRLVDTGQYCVTPAAMCAA